MKQSKKIQKWITVWCPVTGEISDISPRRAAMLTGRSLATAQRWASGAPISAQDMRTLRLLELGILPDPAWQHFRLRGGALIDLRTRQMWEPHQLEATWIIQQQVPYLQQRVTHLDAQIDSLRRALGAQIRKRCFTPVWRHQALTGTGPPRITNEKART